VVDRRKSGTTRGDGKGSDGAMYFNTIDWSQMDTPENRAFFEDIKKFIRIRRMYPGIFENFPDSTRKANIVKLETKRNGIPNPLQAYARTSKDQAILVVPNFKNTERSKFEIFPDLDALGLSDSLRFRIVDLMTNTVVAKGTRSDLGRFSAEIDGEHLGIFLIGKRLSPNQPQRPVVLKWRDFQSPPQAPGIPSSARTRREMCDVGNRRGA